MPQRCGNCIASEPLRLAPRADEPAKVIGLCHLNPPVMTPTPQGLKPVLPAVNPFEDWCMSWGPKPGFTDTGDRVGLAEPQKAPAIITQ